MEPTPFWTEDELAAGIAEVRAMRMAAGFPPSITDPEQIALLAGLLKPPPPDVLARRRGDGRQPLAAFPDGTNGGEPQAEHQP